MFDWFGNTLYFPGCLTNKAYPELQENYEKIFKKMGLDFIKTPQKYCCGSPVLNAGYDEEYEKLVEKNKHLFKKYSVKKIVTNCPSCYHVLKKQGFNVEHATTTILKAIMEGKLQPLKREREKMTYHDPCHLGRYSNQYEEPRKALKLLGYELVEMKDNKGQALCCGGGGGVANNQPSLSDEMSEERVNQAENTGAEVLVTTCPLCAAKLDNPRLKVKEFSQAVLEAIR